MSAPLAAAPREALARVRCVLTDLDDTLTEHGAVHSDTLGAIERLRAAGVPTIVVTGRPAGWCDALVRLWPILGIVGENGALAFWRTARGAIARRTYVEARRFDKLMACARAALADQPALRLAADQPFRIADIAVDFAEDVGPFPLAAAERVRDLFRAQGFQSTISSIHVNAWAGAYSKASTALDLLCALDLPSEATLYVGDSANDEPNFATFELTVGVANIAPFLPMMAARPRWITAAARGAGFVELANALIAARAAQ